MVNASLQMFHTVVQPGLKLTPSKTKNERQGKDCRRLDLDPPTRHAQEHWTTGCRAINHISEDLVSRRASHVMARYARLSELAYGADAAKRFEDTPC